MRVATGPYFARMGRLEDPLVPGHAPCDDIAHQGCGRHYHCANCGQPTNHQGHLVGEPPAFSCPTNASA